MRVLYVEAARGFGGSLTGLLDLFDALPAGVVPLLATAYDPQPFTQLPPTLEHRELAIPTEPAHPGHWLRGTLHYYKYRVRPWSRGLHRLIDELQPHLIHANNSALSNLAVSLVGRQRAIPTISHEKHFEYVGRLSRMVLRHSRYSHHIATSHAVAGHLQDLGLDPRRLTTIYEPVRGPRKNCIAPQNPLPVVAMHSMLAQSKGQHVFLRAVAEVRHRCAQPFRVVVAGTSPTGETEYSNFLERIVKEAKLEEMVEFRGHVSDVNGFLGTVDVAVHASVDREPFGRVVAEAMAAGVPGIVTTGGGPSEYVVDGATGLHVPRDDVAATANAIELLITSPELRRRMGAAAREFASTEFEPESIARQTVELYRRLLRHARPRHDEADLRPRIPDAS